MYHGVPLCPPIGTGGACGLGGHSFSRYRSRASIYMNMRHVYGSVSSVIEPVTRLKSGNSTASVLEGLRTSKHSLLFPLSLFSIVVLILSTSFGEDYFPMLPSQTDYYIPLRLF